MTIIYTGPTANVNTTSQSQLQALPLPSSLPVTGKCFDCQTSTYLLQAPTYNTIPAGGLNDSSVKQTNQEAAAGSGLTSAMVTGGDISPAQGN